MKGLFIGLTSIDLIYTYNHFLQENAKHKTEDQMIDIGGPATNAAFAFSALGGNSTLISLIGQQPFGAFMREKLKAYHIHHIDLNPTLHQRPEISSIIVNRQTGSRTIATVKPLKDIPLDIQEINLQQYDVICIDGFYGEYTLQLLKQNSTDIPVIFDGGSMKPYTEEVLDYVSYPIFSERFTFSDGQSIQSQMGYRQIQQFAITQGEDPIAVWDKGNQYTIEVPKIQAIDTLGAGDIFHGAFSWYILQNQYNFKAALSSAAQIASESCRYFGPRAWVR